MLGIGLTCLVLLAPVFTPGTKLVPMFISDSENDANDADSESLLLSVRYYEKKAEEGTEGAERKDKVFAEGSLAIESGRRFWYFSGGTLTDEGTKHEHPFRGTNFEGKVSRTSDNKYRLSMSTSVGTCVFQSSTPGDVVTRSNQVGLQLTMELGETTRVSCGGQEWCEVRIEKMPETNNAAP